MFKLYRRGAYRIVAVSVAVGFLQMCSVPAAMGEPKSRPNLVVIMADDLGYGDLSCYGNEKFKTPHLDAMAAKGMRFTDFHSSGCVCSPTRAGLLTGRYQQRAGIPGVINADPKKPVHHTGLYPTEVTFAECLEEAGYTCAIFGKWHLGYHKKFNPMHHGFDRFRGYVSGNIDYISHYDRVGIYDWWEGLEHVQEEGYSTHLITKHAVKFIEENKDRPFCVYVAHEAVHSPYQGPGDPPIRGPKKVRGGKVDVGRAYREMTQEMDKGVGDIVAVLKRLDLAGKTLVFFFSDNGGTPRGSNRPLRGFKGSLWEGGHREPAIAYWPGRIEPGAVCDQLAISLDMMPTMLELAGANVPNERKLDGVSLAPLLTKGKKLRPRPLFWGAGKSAAMRDGPWKLLVGARECKGPQLFNLEDDIGETTNLAEKHPERVKKMTDAIEAWREDVAAGATPQPGEHP